MEVEKENVLINLLKSIYISLDHIQQTIDNGYILYSLEFEKINSDEVFKKIANLNNTKKEYSVLLNKGESSFDKQKELIDIVDQIRNCSKCELGLRRISTVPGVGPINSKVMIIGEAPGQQEDIQGLPFVGKAGQLLTKLLTNSGIEREKIFITNIVKCRPPDNRVPKLDEMIACSEYLKKQIKLIKPKFIITLGSTSIQFLLQKKVSISKIRGILIEKDLFGDKILIYPTYHPSFLLRDSNNIPIAQKDFDKIALLLKKNKLI